MRTSALKPGLKLMNQSTLVSLEEGFEETLEGLPTADALGFVARRAAAGAQWAGTGLRLWSQPLVLSQEGPHCGGAVGRNGSFEGFGPSHRSSSFSPRPTPAARRVLRARSA